MKNSSSKFQIYSLWGILRISRYLLRTRLFYPNVRLIRFPIDIRGRKYIDFGKNLTTGVGCRIEAYPFFTKSVIVKFGRNIEINDYVHIAGIQSIDIGDNVLIASKVFISDIQHGCYSGIKRHDHPDSIPKDRLLTSEPVVIKENVWISENVAILNGVTIGRGSIIGANSVVTKDIPDYSIAVGSPAKVIKTYNEQTGKWETVK